MALAIVESLVNEARSILNNLNLAAGDLELAIEREAQCRRIAAEAKRNYDDLETEVSADALFSSDAKNAEGRKAQVDLAVIRSRQVGALAQPYALMLATGYEWDDAKMALEQCIRRFRGCETAADLSAAILKAVSSK